jgi:hypothetical protein
VLRDQGYRTIEGVSKNGEIIVCKGNLKKLREIRAPVLFRQLVLLFTLLP